MKKTTLYAKSSTGDVKEWAVEVDKNADGTATIKTFHGKKGGTITQKDKVIRDGKNIGKANETTPYEQAVKEAESTIQKKRDKGYQDSTTLLSDPVLPMLAHKYIDRGKDIVWPAYIQPKLNGVRCMAHMTPAGVELLSRGGKVFQFSEHIKEELTTLFSNIFTKYFGEQVDLYLDGELFKQDVPLQDILRATRKQSGDTDRSKDAGIEYHIYDCFILDAPGSVQNWTFGQRYKVVSDAISDDKYQYIIPVHTRFVPSPKQALKCYENFLTSGFEGGILRNIDSQYKIGHRSADLQKLKQFFDAEYEIIGAFEGTGTEEGLVNWICKTPDGKEFNVRPRGSFEERAKLWKNYKKYVGKKLTVTYQEMTKDGIPHICVGTGVRDYE